jgi:hypothetical protein
VKMLMLCMEKVVLSLPTGTAACEGTAHCGAASCSHLMPDILLVSGAEFLRALEFSLWRRKMMPSEWSSMPGRPASFTRCHRMLLWDRLVPGLCLTSRPMRPTVLNSGLLRSFPTATMSKACFRLAPTSAMDLYQFICQELAEDFGLNYPETAGYYECDEIYENGSWIPVDEDEVVFPCFVVLAAGWSCAMWAMHATVSHVLSGSSDAASNALIVEDKRITPLVRPGFPIAGTYVDNFSILGCGQVDA